MIDALLYLYVGLSLVLGIAAVTYEIRHQPTMLDRADGRGKFPSPKMQSGELVLFGVFIATLWPILAIAALLDSRSASNP